MKGWLVVNSFVNHSKFTNLYEMLLKAFTSRGVELELKHAKDIGYGVGDVDFSDVKPDFCMFWDKDIYLAKKLESKGIRLFNSGDSIEFCDNKIITYQILEQADIRTPKTYIAPKTFEGLGYYDLTFVKDIAEKIGYPLVIKEARGSFGKQVYLAHNFEEAEHIIKSFGYKDFLLQEFIKSSCGRDIRINVVGHKAIVSMLRENPDDFRSNISNGGSGKPFSPKPDYIALAEEASRALNLDFGGIDVMFGPNDEPIICEVNSNPQFASTKVATGVDLSEYIADYVIKTLCKE